MKFKGVTMDELHDLVATGGYPGGSTKTDFMEFRAYVRAKRLKHCETGETVSAVEEYEYCSWANTQSVRKAEDRLLGHCDGGGCPFNVHGRSNLPDDEVGVVYVLHN